MKEPTKIEEILLVSIWHLADKAYGVKIRQHVSSIIGRELTYGHLYSALNQMVAKKFVTKSMRKSEAKRLGRPRLYYSLTPEGIEALKTAMVINEKLWSGISRYAFEKEK